MDGLQGGEVTGELEGDNDTEFMTRTSCGYLILPRILSSLSPMIYPCGFSTLSNK